MGIAAIAMVAVAAAAPPVPTVLSTYVHDGQFDPGDYGWMRGAFDGATPAQRADWLAITAWRETCVSDDKTAIAAQFAQRGVKLASADLGMGSGLCEEVRTATPESDQGEDWPAFKVALAQARPVAQAIIWSAAIAQSIHEARDDSEAEQLQSRPMTDQLLRTALAWNDGYIKGAPPLAQPRTASSRRCYGARSPNAITRIPRGCETMLRNMAGRRSRVSARRHRAMRGS